MGIDEVRVVGDTSGDTAPISVQREVCGDSVCMTEGLHYRPGLK